ELGETREQLTRCHVSRVGLHKGGPVEFSPRVTTDKGVAFPPRRSKCRPAIHWVIEVQTTDRLMLRRVVKRAGFINHLREVPRMARRKSVVTPRLDVQQLIQWIAVGKPCRPLLVRAEQITRRIERQRHGETDPGGHNLPATEIR